MLRLFGTTTAQRLANIGGKSRLEQLSLHSLIRRQTHSDGTRAMIGDRQVVGYGINGCPIYFDCVAFPFPAIRYREVTPEICALQEKELKDWKKMSLEEKKMLYRYSFCQTFSEFMYITPIWKLCLGIGFWASAVGVLISLWYSVKLYDEFPITFDEEHRESQLRRIIQCNMEPITGISSKWDYDKNRWK